MHAKHIRAKRAIGDDQNVHLKFSAHGENFHLRLKRDLTTFSNDLEVVTKLSLLPGLIINFLFKKKTRFIILMREKAVKGFLIQVTFTKVEC